MGLIKNSNSVAILDSENSNMRVFKSSMSIYKLQSQGAT